MEELPIDIENKIEQLPIVDMNESEEFQKVILSETFNDVFDFYKTNYLPDVLKDKPEIYQRVSLYLSLTGQGEKFIEDTDDVLYRRPVPAIEEFLESNRYMGLQNGNMFPYWKEKLCEIFAQNSSINRVLWSGATGTGKTVTARKAIIYCLYRLLCLRYPRAVLGVETASTLAVFILSVTQKTAYQTNFEPFVTILSNMPCFQRVRNMTSFENFDIDNPTCPFPFFIDKSNMTIVFKDNIILTLGSQISNTVGYDIVITGADEVNELGVHDGMELLNSIDGRIQGRFASSPFIFANVMSSARSTDSVTKEYVKKWITDPGFLYLHPMRFEVKQSAEFTAGEKFIVQVGNGTIPSKILTDPGVLLQIENNEYEPPAGCEIVKVPGLYKQQFEADIEQSIQDILGIDTKDTKNVFRDTSRLEDPQLLPEIYLEANIHDNVNLLENLPLKEMFVQDIKGQWEFRRAPRALRYCHVDLSGGGSDGQCDSGIAIVHKEWKRNEVTGEKETIYVTDLALTVNAKNKIDIHAIQNMLTDLVIERNAPIHTISSDQWNGVIFQQALEASGCFEKVKQVSVDSKLEPYTNAARLIELGHVKVGTCPKLKRELEALILVKNKVTRTTELKDEADAIVGSIYNAQMNYNDVPVYEYETLEEKLARHDKVDYTKYLKDYEEFEELK